MRTWGVGTLLVAALCAVEVMASGCGESRPHPLAAEASPSIVPAYADTMPPTKAVMALVPSTASTLAVTDLDQAKVLLGAESVTGHAPDGDQRAMWGRIDHETPQVTAGLLRGVDAELRGHYGWGAADVRWQASFTGGFAIRVADSVQPQRAIQAGLGPLKGAAYDAARHLITKGTVTVGSPSWASDPAMVAIAPGPAASTYVAKGCTNDVPGAGDDSRLQPLRAYSVEFGGGIATVRLGSGREDVFERMGLGAGVPAYAQTFTHGVADPGSGRMGFRLSDPVLAASLVTREPLPFAACG